MGRLLVLLLVALTACGPTNATTLVLDTEELLQEARAAGAPEKAPYEYHAATLYLNKSREEIGEAHYEDAVALAEKAKELARSARLKALGAAR